MRIRQATIEDTNELRLYYTQQFPDKPQLHDMDLWLWTFTKKPYSKENISFYLIEENNTICGGIGFIPIIINANDIKLPACHPVNYFVSPEYKGLPALRLLRKVLDIYPNQYASYVSDDAARLLKTAGFIDLSSKLNNFYYPFNNNKITTTANNAIQLRHIAIDYTRKLWRRILPILNYPFLDPKIEVHITQKLRPTMIPHINISANHSIGIAKDYDYIKWRYRDCPRLSCIYFYTSLNNTATSLLVLTIPSDSNTAIILDVVSSNYNFSEIIYLLSAVFDFCTKNNILSLKTSLTNKETGRIFKLTGFGPTISNYRFMVYSRNKETKESLSDIDKWDFFIGNTDVY